MGRRLAHPKTTQFKSHGRCSEGEDHCEPSARKDIGVWAVTVCTLCRPRIHLRILLGELVLLAVLFLSPSVAGNRSNMSVVGSPKTTANHPFEGDLHCRH